MLTLPEAAAAMRVSRSTVFELAGRGELPTVRIGRARRVLPDDLADFIARRRVAREGDR